MRRSEVFVDQTKKFDNKGYIQFVSHRLDDAYDVVLDLEAKMMLKVNHLGTDTIYFKNADISAVKKLDKKRLENFNFVYMDGPLTYYKFGGEYTVGSIHEARYKEFIIDEYEKMYK